jgi:hypothetical protein
VKKSPDKRGAEQSEVKVYFVITVVITMNIQINRDRIWSPHLITVAENLTRDDVCLVTRAVSPVNLISFIQSVGQTFHG